MQAAEPRPGATAAAASALAAAEVETLLAPIAGAGLIALAVSGGADSLALLAAVAAWRRAPRRPRVVVLTVDHGLRPGSAAEAAGVVAAADRFGLPAAMLAWAGPVPERDIEAVARAARYRLLLGRAMAEGASHLLVAHHLDDQAETFLMRLARGAGAFGLAGMRPLVDAGGIAIFRPFLDVPRARLAATTAAAGLVPADDPMNRDPRFLRARLRTVMPRLAAKGLDAETLAAAARRFARAAEAVDAGVDRLVAGPVAAGPFAVAAIAAADYAGAAGEVRIRLLSRLAAALGGEPFAPRSSRLGALDAALLAHRSGRLKRTLGGMVAEWRQGRFHFYREAGRAGLPSVSLGPGEAVVWDDRFHIAAGPGLPPGLAVGPLGPDARRVPMIGAAGLPAAAAAALPAVRHGDRILAVPGEGGAAESAGAGGVTMRSLLAARLAAPRLFPQLAPAADASGVHSAVISA